MFKDGLPAAEQGDVYDVTERVNGQARLKLAERKAIAARAYKVLVELRESYESERRAALAECVKPLLKGRQ